MDGLLGFNPASVRSTVGRLRFGLGVGSRVLSADFLVGEETLSGGILRFGPTEGSRVRTGERDELRLLLR